MTVLIMCHSISPSSQRKNDSLDPPLVSMIGESYTKSISPVRNGKLLLKNTLLCHVLAGRGSAPNRFLSRKNRLGISLQINAETLQLQHFSSLHRTFVLPFNLSFDNQKMLRIDLCSVWNSDAKSVWKI